MMETGPPDHSAEKSGSWGQNPFCGGSVMQWWKKAPEPGISPDDAPGRHSDHYGAHAGETSHIQSIPALARRIGDELPEKFDFLPFSAVVYRYEIAQVWWIDIAVFGLDADDIDSPLGE